MQGGAIGFYQGDVTKLLEDLAVLQPTVFPSVPRLFNRIYDKLVQVQLRSWLGCCVPVVKATALIWAVWLSVQGVAVAGGLKKFLFDYALASKSYYLKDGFTQHKLWDKLVFGKVCCRCIAPTPCESSTEPRCMGIIMCAAPCLAWGPRSCHDHWLRTHLVGRQGLPPGACLQPASYRFSPRHLRAPECRWCSAALCTRATA